MKNPAEPLSTTDDLPSFLDTGTGAETGDTGTLMAADDAEMLEHEHHGDEELLDETLDHEGAGQEAAQGAKLLRRRRAPADRVAASAPGNGTVTFVLGGLSWVLALLSTTALADSNAAVALLRFGLGAPTLVVLGAVLCIGGVLQRRVTTLYERVGRSGNDDGELSRSTQESLEFLVAAQHASNERPPAAGEELQHVLMAMQRQEEKINNLTKAIKMYAKPLMEISGQTTDLAGAIAQAKTAIEASSESGRQAFARLEAQLRDDTSGTRQRTELLDALHVIAADVDKLGKKGGGMSLEPLQQQIGKIEVAVAAMAQRLESSEVQKSLLRLEDATQKTRDEVHQLRGDGLGKATTQLQERLDKATKGLTDGLQQMRDGNLGGLETGVREIQRELSGVATAVAQIQAVVRSGKASAAAPQPAAPAPAPAAPAASTHQPATPAAAPGQAEDANSSYQTGTRSTSSKNVLGAIAKLKQMKN